MHPSGFKKGGSLYEPGSKLLVLGMVIQPVIGNPYNGYINPYYWVDDHPLLYGNNGSLDPGTYNGVKWGPNLGKGIPWIYPPGPRMPSSQMKGLFVGIPDPKNGS